jgi:predicted RND superfamily exporter protein
MKPSFFSRNSLRILMIVAFLCPFMFMGARQALRSNKNNVGSWLPAHCAETANFKWYRERFESDMFVLVSWDGCTLDDPRLGLLAAKLVPPPDPNQHPLNAPIEFFKSVRTGKQLLDELVEKQGLTEEEAIQRLKGFVIGKDGRQTCLVLTVRQETEERWDALREKLRFWWSKPAPDAPPLGPASGSEKFLHAVVNRVATVATEECMISPQELHMGGPPVDNAAIDMEGEKSLLRLAGVSALVGLIMSWWCLRSWGLTLMVFSAALFTAGLSLLVVHYSGAQMNAILLTMPSLVYVAAVSGAIHLANYYRDTVRENGFDGAPDRAVGNAWLPLALATGTTAIGLASMMITNLVPIRMFGLYSAIGVVISFFVVCFYVPSVMHYFPLKNIVAPESRRFDPGLSPKWRHVGEFIIRHNGFVTAACLTLMAVGVYGVTKTESSVKLMRLFSGEARILADYKWLEDRLGPLVPMEVVVRIDTTKCDLDLLDRMKLVAQVAQSMRGLEDVGSTLAAPTFARTLPSRPNFIERQAWKTQLEEHRPALREYLCTEGDEELWRVSARVAALTNLDYGDFVKDIEKSVEPVLTAYRAEGYEGISATYTGLVPLIYQAQSSMLDGLILNFVGDLILIGLAIILLLRNFSAGFLLALPSLFPMAIVFGAMGMMGIVVDVGTVMVPAVALGVTIDDAIHFMLWCRHGEERGLNKRESIMFAYKDCARAIYQSWGVIGLGLFSFALSTFTPTQRFGYMMLLMLTASSIGNLVMLPAILAGPLGRYFWLGDKAKKRKHAAEEDESADRLPLEIRPDLAEEALEEREEVVLPLAASTMTVTTPHTKHDKPRRMAGRNRR